MEGNVNSNIAGWVSVIDFDLDSSSLVVSSDQAEKPSVRANLSANYTPAISSSVALVMDTDVYDNLGNYNNSGGIFIVPVTGWYRIDVSLEFIGAGINYASITGH